MAGPPKKIMIIRHGEKPPKHPGSTGPFDVQEDGESGSGNSLIVIGWQRAGALNAFFAPAEGSPPKKDIAKPDYIYAANPSGESQRPCETVTPLAAWLGYKQGTQQFNVSFDIGGGEGNMVNSAIALDGTVLICWEHDNIYPNVVNAIKSHVPITNYSAIKPWPNVFDLVWVFDLDSKGKNYTWNSLHQDLMAGDGS